MLSAAYAPHSRVGATCTHTDLTDGIVSLQGMIAVAEARGYKYYVGTDHAPNLADIDQ